MYAESLKKAVNENVRRDIRLQLVLVFSPSHMYLLTKPYLIHMSSSFLSCLIAPLFYCIHLSLSFLPLFHNPVTVQTPSYPALLISMYLCGLVWRGCVFVLVHTVCLQVWDERSRARLKLLTWCDDVTGLACQPSLEIHQTLSRFCRISKQHW